jgi:hypothetical protein
VQIEALRDKFAANTSDVDSIKALDSEGGCAVLTAERRLKTRPHERLALDRSNIVFFFLTGAWLKFSVPGNGVAADPISSCDGNPSRSCRRSVRPPH